MVGGAGAGRAVVAAGVGGAGARVVVVVVVVDGGGVVEVVGVDDDRRSAASASAERRPSVVVVVRPSAAAAVPTSAAVVSLPLQLASTTAKRTADASITLRGVRMSPPFPVSFRPRLQTPGVCFRLTRAGTHHVATLRAAPPRAIQPVAAECRIEAPAPASGRGGGGSGGVAALADHGQSAVPPLDVQIVDVDTERFGDPEPVQPASSVESAASSSRTSPGKVWLFGCSGSISAASSPSSRSSATPDSAARIAFVRSSAVGLCCLPSPRPYRGRTTNNRARVPDLPTCVARVHGPRSKFGGCGDDSAGAFGGVAPDPAPAHGLSERGA